ncbi:hypothetical protein BDP81DRAFT_493273 [Colletotrichum phormii]|uniref:Uncharacterized protein n=1 Tax=Colletotrichum phormii TaxID=359342 RepID=A0AAJ0EDF1_9PEZI|nr:uncharacterized protein BDP81DRAFT_493273 [Colletotrichum phormii]KAK1634959.1 hypothetical protein BDP81DRAFT_493273 [Colletotrichum phormii]
MTEPIRRSLRLQNKGAAHVPEAPKVPAAPARRANKKYVRKQEEVISDLKGNMEMYSAEAQQVIVDMQSRLQKYEADEQARRGQQQTFNFSTPLNTANDDNSEFDAMSVDSNDSRSVGAAVKKEAQVDEGLFVPRNPRQSATLIVEDDEDDDPASLISLRDIFDQTGDDDIENTTRYGFLEVGPYRTYNVVGRGPRNAEKLELVPSNRDPVGDAINNLSQKKKVLRDGTGRKLKVDGINIQVDIQGVAWIATQNPADPITLMDPRYWDKMKSEGKKNVRMPYTLIKLKWVTIRNGEKTVEKTFESRSTVRSIFGKTPRAALRTYKIGDRVVLEKGTIMPAADLAIFAAAIISWDRHLKWKEDPSTGEDRSPTPDEVLQTTETKHGRRQGAR